MKKLFLISIGYVFSLVNMLPLPWSVRVFWMKSLYSLTVLGTSLFPSILSWTEKQNIKFKMGKQEGEDYESLVQLEKVLEYLENNNYTVEQIKWALNLAESEKIPNESFGSFIALKILEEDIADQLLKDSLAGARY